ncbi:MAG TPA: hypothetical protein VKB51_01915 [bacterium]|nr:hypothetical protein [bacterium]
MSSIESRLAAVERQLRFHRLVIAGLLVALVALVGYGATKGVPDVIRAKRFEAVNSKDSVGAELDMFGLTVKDVFSGEPYIWLSYATPDGPDLALFANSKGIPKGNDRMRVQIMARGEDDPGGLINIASKTGVAIQLLVDHYGVGKVGVFGPDGKGRTLTPR